MKGHFTEEQKQIIRKWAHHLDNAFHNFRYVQEELAKDAILRDSVMSVHEKSLRKLESVIVAMNEASPREMLPEVSHG